MIQVHNYSSLAAFIISAVCFAVYLFFLTPRQLEEVLRPRDWLTRLRLIILGILLISLLTSVPSLLYQYYRTIGQEHVLLRNVSTVTSNISKLGLTVLLVLVFTYRKRN
jgi:hypothetical protein